MDELDAKLWELYLEALAVARNPFTGIVEP